MPPNRLCLAPGRSSVNVARQSHQSARCTWRPLRRQYNPPGLPGLTYVSKKSSASVTASEDVDDETAPVTYKRESVNILSQNLPLDTLVSQVKNGIINLQPEYQRDFVWDQQKCMGLIKTVFECLPVPAVMLYRRKSANGRIRHEVVDGKQRLVTLYSFIEGDNSKFPDAPTVISLERDDELAPVLNGKRFADLSAADQEAMRYFALQVQYIPEDTPPQMVYRIYENINAGGMEHSAQQLRRAAFFGSYIQLISQLARPDSPSGELLESLADLTPEEQKAMQAEELVLRFFAMRNAAASSPDRPYRRSMKEFLNEELQRVNQEGPKVLRELTQEEQKNMEKDFKATMRLVKSLGFKGVAEDILSETGSKVKSFRRVGSTLGAGPLWDTTLVGLQRAMDSRYSVIALERKATALKAAFAGMLRSARWRDIKSTFNRKTHLARLELFEEVVIDAVMQGEKKQTRTFSKAQLKALWDTQPAHICAWCGDPIDQMDHAEVDHVVPWAAGGDTSLGNAQLLHSYCNRQKGDRPMRSPAPVEGLEGAGEGQAAAGRLKGAATAAEAPGASLEGGAVESATVAAGLPEVGVRRTGAQNEYIIARRAAQVAEYFSSSED